MVVVTVLPMAAAMLHTVVVTVHPTAVVMLLMVVVTRPRLPQLPQRLQLQLKATKLKFNKFNWEK
jgi:hypothetical protein